ncbi:MAG: M48 family metallopeptidase [Bacteroidota bacterium]|nr:M48 family metallopeptidase [Bacteroidota bacterium]
MKTIKYISILSLILLLVACSTVPFTGRKQIKLLPESILLSMSLANYNEFLSANKPLPKNNVDAKMVKQAGLKISRAVTNFFRNNDQKERIKDFDWTFELVNDPTANAWCMPGGKVVVFNGILPYTKNEDGLACVMGHEIAHAVARHGNERLSQQLLIALGGISLQVALKEKPEKTKQLFLLAYGAGSTLGSLAYSRQHETEADKLGMIFMAMAGYHPSKAIEFWERFSASGGQEPPEFLSTHPSNSTRIKNLKKFLPEAMKYYKQ